MAMHHTHLSVRRYLTTKASTVIRHFWRNGANRKEVGAMDERAGGVGTMTKEPPVYRSSTESGKLTFRGFFNVILLQIPFFH